VDGEQSAEAQPPDDDRSQSQGKDHDELRQEGAHHGLVARAEDPPQGEEERPVGHRVEAGAKPRLTVEATRNDPVDGVGSSGQQHQGGQ